MHPWPNGYGAGLRSRRFGVRVPAGAPAIFENEPSRRRREFKVGSDLDRPAAPFTKRGKLLGEENNSYRY